MTNELATVETDTEVVAAADESLALQSVTVERGEGGEVTLTIQVAPEGVREMREKVVKDYGKRLKIAGFRPGRIPPNIVRRNVGDEAIAQRVSDELIPIAYQQALQQEGLLPLVRAEVDQLTFDAFNGQDPLEFTAKVVVRPEITLGELKGLEATRPAAAVTDEDVELGLDGLRHEHATLINVEGRGAELSDVLNAELQVYVDGEPRAEAPTPLRAFVLGESGFMPSIDEHLIGAELDETRRFDVTYPSDYQDEELAGQVAEFEIKILSLKSRQLPEINDEFAAGLGLETEEALRARMREIISSDKERASQNSVRNQLVEAAVAGTQIEVPTTLAHRRVHTRLHSMESDLEQRGTNMEQYLAQTGQTSDELHDNLQTEMENELRRELVLEEIARIEKMEVSGQELESHYYMMAQVMQQPVEKVLEQFDVNTVQASLLQRKAVDWLLEHANITDESPEEAAIEPAAE